MPYYGAEEEETSIFNVVGLAVVMTGSLIGAIFGVLLPTVSMGVSLGILGSLFASTVRKRSHFMHHLHCG